ncbi:porphobilinogen synthase [Arsenicitalea aurantiaca]|uniref:Delta-aminolevulinic acid dehydratase n=1 Tax=Arsenicitalea aurantiaca TaxID=1783274 RepID=A0A433XEV6_9HYPH|nr:porphobilinogen synthase [Arsenicitalea aurantiaca]RUT32534.1 porphobilinogen synthase [Arsenicitalea aurantiaca]
MTQSWARHDMDFLGGRRLRRMRRTPWSRALVRETTLSPADLIWPLFLIEGQNERSGVRTMPGVERLSVDLAVEAAREAAREGIPALALFPNTAADLRTEGAEEAWNPDNLTNRAIRAIKDAVPEIGLIADVALDPYTSHGHDGVMAGDTVLNDETVALLCRQALAQAEAGADIVAPSDMMDGRVGAIRAALDEAGHEHVAIMAYAAKFASAFYGPFREAVGSGARLRGDKRTYQLDYANAEEALREVELDLAEGADMVMVKPGMPYLDIVRQVRDSFNVPVFAYQVSGEYAMIAMAGEAGAIDRQAAMMESLFAFKRAGAKGVLTYFALETARILNR